VSRRQAGRWQEQAQEQQYAAPEPQYAPPPPAPAADSMDDKIKQLQELGQLHEQGILTDEEFAAQKSKLLG
jgi:hypothetical protein